MSLNSKYFNAIRVKSIKKNQENENKKTCAFAGCCKLGKHKAVMRGAENNKNYTYFCLEHIQEYNKNFNFFDELPEETKQKFIHTKTTEEPIVTSKLSLGDTPIPKSYNTIRSGSAAYQKRVGNNFNLYNIDNNTHSRKLTALEMQAFATLDLSYDATSSDIKTKYKTLVKANHPDANKGDRSYEDRFNAIIAAYKQLQKSGLVN